MLTLSFASHETGVVMEPTALDMQLFFHVVISLVREELIIE